MRVYLVRETSYQAHAMTSVSKTVAVFPLRLPKSTRLEATEVASHQGLSLNQFITLAVTEKIVRMEYEGGAAL